MALCCLRARADNTGVFVIYCELGAAHHAAALVCVLCVCAYHRMCVREDQQCGFLQSKRVQSKRPRNMEDPPFGVVLGGAIHTAIMNHIIQKTHYC